VASSSELGGRPGEQESAGLSRGAPPANNTIKAWRKVGHGGTKREELSGQDQWGEWWEGGDFKKRLVGRKGKPVWGRKKGAIKSHNG